MIAVDELRRFRLGVDDTAQAGIDFLRLDHFVQLTDWTAEHLLSPAVRVPKGRTLPLAEVASDGTRLTAVIDLEQYELDLPTFEARCPFGPGAWVRLSPHSGNPNQGQTMPQLLSAIGTTCIVDGIDWDSGQVLLEQRYANATRYVLPSRTWPEGDVFAAATLDESPSDFVAGVVEDRLSQAAGNQAFSWFDPEDPQVPVAAALPEDEAELLDAFLQEVRVPDAAGRLAPDQRRAIMEGLQATVQLLQGPPGTGKTLTTAVACLLRILARLEPGAVVLLSAHTHTAVNTLLLALNATRAHAGPVTASGAEAS